MSLLRKIGPLVKDLTLGWQYTKAGKVLLDASGNQVYTDAGGVLLDSTGPAYKKVGNLYVDISGKLLTGFQTRADGRIDLNGWTDSRAASLWLPDHEGIIREVPPGVPAIIDPATGRMPRVVRNLLDVSEPYVGGIAAGDFYITGGGIFNESTKELTVALDNDGLRTNTTSFNVPTGDYRIIIDVEYVSGITSYEISSWGTATKTGSTKNITVPTSGRSRICSDVFTVTAPGTLTANIRSQDNGNGVIKVYAFMIEEVTGATNQNPSEYVAVNASSDGFAYYATANANTVDANGVVTEAVGANLPSYGEWGFAHYPSTTNLLKKSSDFTLDGVAWFDYTSGKVSTVQSSNRALDNNFKYDVVANVTTIATYYINSNTTSRSAVQTEYTARINVTPGTATWVRMQIAKSNGAKRAVVRFNLTGAGSVGSTESATYTVTDYSITSEPDGSYTLIVSALTDAVAESDRLTVYAVSGDLSSTITPSTVGETLFSVAMAQLEAHPFATPIVPTTGAPMDRDMCRLLYTTPDIDAQGTVYMSWVPLYDMQAGTRKGGKIIGGDNDNEYILYTNNNTDRLFSYDHTAAVSSPSSPFLEVKGANYKHVVSWGESGEYFISENLAGSWAHGTRKSYDGAYSTDGGVFGISPFRKYGYPAVVKDIVLLNRALTESEIEARWP